MGSASPWFKTDANGSGGEDRATCCAADGTAIPPGHGSDRGRKMPVRSFYDRSRSSANFLISATVMTSGSRSLRQMVFEALSARSTLVKPFSIMRTRN